MNNYIEQFKAGEIVVINSNSVKLQYKLKYNSPVTKTIGVSITYRFNEDEDWKTEVKYTTWKNKEISQFFQLPISTSDKVYLKNLASTGYLYDLNIISENVQATEIDLDEDTYIYNTSIDTNNQNNSSYASQDWVEEQIGQINYIAPTIETIMPIVNNVETISSKVNDINDNLITKEQIINIIDNYLETKNNSILPTFFKEELDESDTSNIEIDDNNHIAVDLGLPSRTKWATCNIFANNVDTQGAVFQYGETTPFYTISTGNYDDLYNFNKNITINWKEGKEQGYIAANNKYYDQITKKYTKYNSTDNIKELESDDDPATQLWGTAWQTPTKEQWEELIEECSWEYCNDYMYTFKIIGRNGNFIYLPFSGYMHDKLLNYIPYGTSHTCMYMSKTLEEDVNFNYNFYYYENGIYSGYKANDLGDEGIIVSIGNIFGTGTNSVTGEVEGYEVDYDINGNPIELDLGTDENGEKIRRVISADAAINKYITAVTAIEDKYNVGDIIRFRSVMDNYDPNTYNTDFERKYICTGINTHFEWKQGAQHVNPSENGIEQFLNYIWKPYDRLEPQIGADYRWFGTHVRPVTKSKISGVIGDDGPRQYVSNVKYPNNMIILNNNISPINWYNRRGNVSNSQYWKPMSSCEQLYGLSKKDLLYLSLGIYNCIKFSNGEIIYVTSVTGDFLNYNCTINFGSLYVEGEGIQKQCSITNRWNTSYVDPETNKSKAREEIFVCLYYAY